MENQPKINSSKEVIAFLAQRFPQCFSVEGEACPLKIGIFQDLVERMQGDESALSKTQLRSALRLYTSSWRYLHSVKAGAERIDLDGNPCGMLDEQHVVHARQQLNEAKARVQAQRAERQQQMKKQKKEVNPTENSPSHSVVRYQETSSEKNILSRKERVQQQGQVSQVKNNKVRILPVADIKQLQIGQEVKINTGKSSVEASVLEVTKDGVRVQLPNGLAVIVRAEHLQF